MKNIIIRFTGEIALLFFLILGLIIAYGIGSFINADLGVSNWGITFREQVAFYYVVYVIMVLVVYSILKVYSLE